MAYTPLTSAEIASGKPNSSAVATKIKDNFNDHEARLTDIENGTNISYPPIVLRVNGAYPGLLSATKTAIIKTTCNFSLRITGVKLLIDVAGSSGTTEVDILTNTSGSFVSIFTTKPSLAYTAGNDSISSNEILDATKTTLAAGNIIRLDIPSSQVSANGLMVRIDYEKV